MFIYPNFFSVVDNSSILSLYLSSELTLLRKMEKGVQVMKKQTKLAAAASAAALLAMGASFSSFASTGWVEEDGVWYYYDKDGSRAADEWKKSGDNWYWLDGDNDGAMAADKLVEDDDNYYYVGADGVMVRNVWVKIENEDQDDADDPAEYHYYYMQSNGKAYKAGTNGSTSFKNIDGKKYAFDEEGRMLYGWVNGQSERLTGDTDWNANSDDEDIYYLGTWEDGAMKTGWQKLTVCDDLDDEEEKDFWFWFKSNGKKYTAEKGNLIKEDKQINGKKYGFDERGVMAYEWVLATDDGSMTASTSSWRYFSSPEDGARIAKGWFKVVAPNDDIENTFKDYNNGTFAAEHADDETERWYYADKNGELYEGEIKKIKGQYYGFYPDSNEKKGGAMLTGLCALKVVDGRIEKVIKENMDLDDLLDCMEPTDEYLEMHLPGSNCSLYYFGNNPDTDGVMRTGVSTVMLSGLPIPFEFSKTGGAESRGKGITGIKDGKYIYKFGYKVTAEADEKYKMVYATGTVSEDDSIVYRVDSQKLRGFAETAVNKNKDGDTIHYVGTMLRNPQFIWESGNVFYLVNTSGLIVKNKTAVKDGYDWYYYVDDKNVRMYTDSKDLNADSKDAPVMDAAGNSLKNDWKKETITTGKTVPNIMDIIDYDGDVAAFAGFVADYIESLLSGKAD